MKNSKKLYCLFLLFFITILTLKAQQTCPSNIGFENGTFSGWQCSAGFIQRDGTLDLLPTNPIDGRHTILSAGSGGFDRFGNFPVICPNGSKYSIRLGNSSAGGQAEGVSYTFTVPANQNDYSIIYNYAVVFQNPPHQPFEQPRFTSKVFNVTDNKYIDCGSFTFVAASDLPGFSMTGDSVFYKPWSPVTVNLSNLAGKTVRLEFTTNDCAFVRHFGYAYIDVNEDCSASPVLGNTFCSGANSITLTAPFGFAAYNWYTADFSTLLGTNNTLIISPAPPNNTTYALEVIPYQNSGCLDTFFTTIRFSPEPFALKVVDTLYGCSYGVDLTASSVTAGSTPNITFSYYTDISQTNYLEAPSVITQSGTYFIKAVSSGGCSDIKPITVIIRQAPSFKITNPEGVCIPQTVSILASAIIRGDTGIAYSYWQNVDATIPVANPAIINKSGIYYIKGSNASGCSSIQPVTVKVSTVPDLITRNTAGCERASLTAANITAGSTAGLTYTYWMDSSATTPVPAPSFITSSAKYFIKGTTDSGCSVIKPVFVTINKNPIFIVKDPPEVRYPVLTVDITSSVIQNTGLAFTYWLDTFARRRLLQPASVDKRGTYYIKGTDENGCSTILPVSVKIIPPEAPIVYAPNAFTPNNDGLNDEFSLKIVGEVSISHLRIYNRWGQVMYEDPDVSRSWNGKYNGIDQPPGVYIWIINGTDTYYKKTFTKKGVITLIR